MTLFFGRRPVLEALAAKTPVRKILIAIQAQGPIIDRIIKMATEQGVSVTRVSRQQIDAISPGQVHQGVVAETWAGCQDNYSFDDLLLDISKNSSPPFLLILDSIEDPHNLGALIRTANGAGAQAVIIPKHRAAGITPIVIKASAGATESTPVIKVANLVQACIILKKKGIWIIGTNPLAKDTWYSVDLTCPIAIVLGGEAKGIRRLLLEECDFVVSLPLLGKISSLNVSVAGGILMYEVLRQRKSKN